MVNTGVYMLGPGPDYRQPGLHAAGALVSLAGSIHLSTFFIHIKKTLEGGARGP